MQKPTNLQDVNDNDSTTDTTSKKHDIEPMTSPAPPKRRRLNNPTGEDGGQDNQTQSDQRVSLVDPGNGILDCKVSDVLSGRGGGTNLHPGNRHYRALILSHRHEYDLANKTNKPQVARKIVKLVRDRGGRFLRKERDGLYYDIGDEAAREKTSQALRHRTFEMRSRGDSSTPLSKSKDILQSASTKKALSPIPPVGGVQPLITAAAAKLEAPVLGEKPNSNMEETHSPSNTSAKSMMQNLSSNQWSHPLGAGLNSTETILMSRLLALRQQKMTQSIDSSFRTGKLSPSHLSPYSLVGRPTMDVNQLLAASGHLNLPTSLSSDPALFLSLADRQATAGLLSSSSTSRMASSSSGFLPFNSNFPFAYFP
eukprot:Nitzschia sp. Nitz4//scaffold60_size111251//44311//45485//NITZ4_004146-RA/size111251-augustus-gene-0.121-mRNA-1//-1//CDS//3329555561//6172//frame0